MPVKVKRGMKGSNKGRSRWEKTEVLKEMSKNLRREEGKKIIKELLIEEVDILE